MLRLSAGWSSEPLVSGLNATRALLARIKDSQLDDAASNHIDAGALGTHSLLPRMNFLE